MQRFLGKIFSLAITAVGASLVAFFLIRLVPGDPVTHLLGERGSSPERIEAMKEKLGLNQSLPQQYLKFLGRAVTGDLGESIVSQRSVKEEIVERFTATAELSLLAFAFSVLLGIPLGIWAATRKGTWVDNVVMGGSLVGYSMPIFWWGLLLIMFFSVRLGWFPVSGRMDAMFDVPMKTGFLLVDVWFVDDSWQAFKSAIHHIFLPAFVLSTIPLAVIARMTRSSMIEVFQEDFMRSLKAKGISRLSWIYKHGLRNAMIPIITVMGLMLGSLLVGAILTETIFSWPGIGRWLVKSVEARDYPVLQGGVLFLSMVVVLINLIVDILYLWAQPRLREGKKI